MFVPETGEFRYTKVLAPRIKSYFAISGLHATDNILFWNSDRLIS